MRMTNLLGSLNGDKIKSTGESRGCAAIALAISFAAAISSPILPVVSITNMRDTSPLIPNRLSKSVSSRISRSFLNTFLFLFRFLFLQWRGKSDSWHRPCVSGQWHSGRIYFNEEIKKIYYWIVCLVIDHEFRHGIVNADYFDKLHKKTFFTWQERRKSHNL